VQERTLSFGYWLRRRRKALDLTQEALAQRVSCSGFSIRRIEADERRLSRQLAEHFERAHAWSKALRYLVQLGMAHRRADAYDAASACHAEALAESRAMNDERHAADTLYHLGTVAWSTGRNDQAIGYHQQAVEICERTGCTDLVAVQAWHGRGEAHFADAKPAPAIECYTRSLALARGIGDKSYECENLMTIGHACVGTKGFGDYPRAIAQAVEASLVSSGLEAKLHLPGDSR
jgi:tetratricopeptide (TPR) repeat protein